MTRILQNTGTATIYQIEAQFPATASQQYRGVWCQREMPPAIFGEEHPKYAEDWRKVAPFFTAYGANGDCWQNTGQNGYLDKAFALKAFAALLASKVVHDKKHVAGWRLVERVVDVRVTVLAEGRIK